MQILLDARKLGDGGIGVYLQNLVDGLLALRQSGEIAFELSMLVSPEALSIARWQGQVELIAERSGKYSIAEYLLLARRQRVALAKRPLFHSPHYTLPFGLRCPTVVTIHDCIHLSHPSRMLNPIVARPLLRSALRRAGRVITVSEFSRAELLRYFPSVRQTIDVVPNGCQVEFRDRLDERRIAEARLRLGISAPYCLFVGNAKLHKGFRELIDAWKLVGAELGEQRPQLVVVGSGFSPTHRAAVAAECGERGVRFLSGLSVSDLHALTQGALASLLPSRIEGFGLPALEALTVGTPVVCSPAPALKELCQDSAWFADDFTARTFAAAVSRVIRDPHGAALKAERGRQRGARFTIEKMGRETWRVYASLLGVSADTGSQPTLRGGIY